MSDERRVMLDVRLWVRRAEFRAERDLHAFAREFREDFFGALGMAWDHDQTETGEAGVEFCEDARELDFLARVRGCSEDDRIIELPAEGGEELAKLGDLSRGFEVGGHVELDAAGAGELFRRDAKGKSEARGI